MASSQPRARPPSFNRVSSTRTAASEASFWIEDDVGSRLFPPQQLPSSTSSSTHHSRHGGDGNHGNDDDDLELTAASTLASFTLADTTTSLFTINSATAASVTARHKPALQQDRVNSVRTEPTQGTPPAPVAATSNSEIQLPRTEEAIGGVGDGDAEGGANRKAEDIECQPRRLFSSSRDTSLGQPLETVHSVVPPLVPFLVNNAEVLLVEGKPTAKQQLHEGGEGASMQSRSPSSPQNHIVNPDIEVQAASLRPEPFLISQLPPILPSDPSPLLFSSERPSFAGDLSTSQGAQPPPPLLLQSTAVSRFSDMHLAIETATLAPSSNSNSMVLSRGISIETPKPTSSSGASDPAGVVEPRSEPSTATTGRNLLEAAAVLSETGSPSTASHKATPPLSGSFDVGSDSASSATAIAPPAAVVAPPAAAVLNATTSGTQRRTVLSVEQVSNLTPASMATQPTAGGISRKRSVVLTMDEPTRPLPEESLPRQDFSSDAFAESVPLAVDTSTGETADVSNGTNGSRVARLKLRVPSFRSVGSASDSRGFAASTFSSKVDDDLHPRLLLSEGGGSFDMLTAALGVGTSALRGSPSDSGNSVVLLSDRGELRINALSSSLSRDISVARLIHGNEVVHSDSQHQTSASGRLSAVQSPKYGHLAEVLSPTSRDVRFVEGSDSFPNSPHILRSARGLHGSHEDTFAASQSSSTAAESTISPRSDHPQQRKSASQRPQVRSDIHIFPFFNALKNASSGHRAAPVAFLPSYLKQQSSTAGAPSESGPRGDVGSEPMVGDSSEPITSAEHTTTACEDKLACFSSCISDEARFRQSVVQDEATNHQAFALYFQSTDAWIRHVATHRADLIKDKVQGLSECCERELIENAEWAQRESHALSFETYIFHQLLFREALYSYESWSTEFELLLAYERLQCTEWEHSSTALCRCWNTSAQVAHSATDLLHQWNLYQERMVDENALWLLWCHGSRLLMWSQSECWSTLLDENRLQLSALGARDAIRHIVELVQEEMIHRFQHCTCCESHSSAVLAVIHNEQSVREQCRRSEWESRWALRIEAFSEWCTLELRTTIMRCEAHERSVIALFAHEHSLRVRRESEAFAALKSKSTDFRNVRMILNSECRARQLLNHSALSSMGHMLSSLRSEWDIILSEYQTRTQLRFSWSHETVILQERCKRHEVEVRGAGLLCKLENTLFAALHYLRVVYPRWCVHGQSTRQTAARVDSERHSASHVKQLMLRGTVFSDIWVYFDEAWWVRRAVMLRRSRMRMFLLETQRWPMLKATHLTVTQLMRRTVMRVRRLNPLSSFFVSSASAACATISNSTQRPAVVVGLSSTSRLVLSPKHCHILHGFFAVLPQKWYRMRCLRGKERVWDVAAQSGAMLRGCRSVLPCPPGARRCKTNGMVVVSAARHKLLRSVCDRRRQQRLEMLARRREGNQRTGVASAGKDSSSLLLALQQRDVAVGGVRGLRVMTNPVSWEKKPVLCIQVFARSLLSQREAMVRRDGVLFVSKYVHGVRSLLTMYDSVSQYSNDLEAAVTRVFLRPSMSTSTQRRVVHSDPACNAATQRQPPLRANTAAHAHVSKVERNNNTAASNTANVEALYQQSIYFHHDERIRPDTRRPFSAGAVRPNTTDSDRAKRNQKSATTQAPSAAPRRSASSARPSSAPMGRRPVAARPSEEFETQMDAVELAIRHWCSLTDDNHRFR